MKKRKRIRIDVSRKDMYTLHRVGDAMGLEVTDENRGLAQVLKYVLRVYGDAIIKDLESSKPSFQSVPELRGVDIDGAKNILGF